LPDTLAIHQAYKNKGLTVLAVTAEKQADVEKWLKGKKMNGLPVFYDNIGDTGKRFNVSAIPTLILIDRDGKLVARFVGLQEPDTIKAALAKAGLKV
jgi:glutathione peroxidase-family protein